MAVVLPSSQVMLCNSISIHSNLESEMQWRVLIQRPSGRCFSHPFGILSRDSGEEVMKKIWRLYIQETTESYRIFAQTILMRRPVISVVRITAVSLERPAFEAHTSYTSKNKKRESKSDDERTESLTYRCSSLCSQRVLKLKKILAKFRSHTESGTTT